MENQQTPLQPQSPTPAKPMKPKYWAVIILTAIAIGAGVVYYAKQPAEDLGPVVVHRETKTQSPATTTPDSELKDWKTHTNAEYGLEFDYPKEFVLKKLDDGTIFMSDREVGSIEIEKQGTINYLLKDFCAYHKEDDFCRTGPIPDTDASFASSSRLIKLNDYSAIKFEMEGIAADSLYLIESPKGEVFSFRIYDTSYGSDPALSVAFHENIDQILSTFKFTLSATSQIDTSGWKTYTNSQYGFEFKYPANKFTTPENQDGNIRIQNYDPNVDSLKGLGNGEYYIETWLIDESKGNKINQDCTKQFEEIDKETTNPGAKFIYGYPNQGGDPGGTRYAVCVDKAKTQIFVQVTENSNNLNIAKNIINSLSFK